VLVILSAILTATTLFPHIDVTTLTEALFAALAVALAGTGAYLTRERRKALGPLDLPAGARRPRPMKADTVARKAWTMPPLELLERPVWSRTRKIGMITLRGYLAIAVLMLIVKAIAVSLGH
jgi:hypothetical protein